MATSRSRPLAGGDEPIARARRRTGLSQTEAARRMGWQPQTWADYERGRKNPTVTMLRRIAAVLGVTVSRLVE